MAANTSIIHIQTAQDRVSECSDNGGDLPTTHTGERPRRNRRLGGDIMTGALCSQPEPTPRTLVWRHQGGTNGVLWGLLVTVGFQSTKNEYSYSGSCAQAAFFRLNYSTTQRRCGTCMRDSRASMKACSQDAAKQYLSQPSARRQIGPWHQHQPVVVVQIRSSDLQANTRAAHSLSGYPFIRGCAVKSIQ